MRQTEVAALQQSLANRLAGGRVPIGWTAVRGLVTKTRTAAVAVSIALTELGFVTAYIAQAQTVRALLVRLVACAAVAILMVLLVRWVRRSRFHLVVLIAFEDGWTLGLVDVCKGAVLDARVEVGTRGRPAVFGFRSGTSGTRILALAPTYLAACTVPEAGSSPAWPAAAADAVRRHVM